MEREIIIHMTKASENSGKPQVRVPVTSGVSATMICLKGAEKAAQSKNFATVNVFVNALGPKECEDILKAQKFLIALSERKTMREALSIADINVESVRGTDKPLRGIQELLGDLPKLAEVLLGRAAPIGADKESGE